MFNYFIIEKTTNKVKDLVVWDGDLDNWQPPSGHYAIIDSGGRVGMIYNSAGVGVGSTNGDTNHMWIPTDQPEYPDEYFTDEEYRVMDMEQDLHFGQKKYDI